MISESYMHTNYIMLDHSAKPTFARCRDRPTFEKCPPMCDKYTVSATCLPLGHLSGNIFGCHN